ncbi:MAG: hypothetical protein L0206_10465, partial [Actinobacteria bacterium]|nr:hypothetical protein [Actinomycetota bacterium]
MGIRGIRSKLFIALAGALLIAGCSSTLGDILGGGRSDPYPQGDIGEVRATVDQVDTRNRIIYVEDAQAYRRDLRNSSGREDLAIYYDERTVVEYDGRSYRPQDLEPGDQIVAQVDETGGNRLFAERIEVVYDVSSSGGSQSDVYADLRGFVRFVDTQDRELELERVTWNRRFDPGSGSGDVRGIVVLEYDANTEVEFQGRRYRPENLERGDEVEVQVRDLGQRLIADDIVVIRDARA